MILKYAGSEPVMGARVFVAPTATVIGQVALGADSSIWYGAILRGDVGSIHIGERTNVQDAAVVHVTHTAHNTVIGNDVTVGHRVILHGCTVADHVLVGMGAVLLDGAEIGPYCFIAAGSLVPPGRRVPAGSMLMGSPARIVRQVTEAERRQIEHSALHYIEVARQHQLALAL